MKLTIKDIYSLLMKFFIVIIIWYMEAIQTKYIQIPNFLLICGILLGVVCFLDCVTLQGLSSLKLIPKPLWVMFIYVILSFFFGFFVTPGMSYHLSHGILVIEFSMIMLFAAYYCVTRNDVNFLMR